ncbi:PREDICTED: tetraspanin-33-like [Priapulus caudatus]|uniref:Tetraspanin n=1 Tax=Priapulus caudatus TaxID=37621 RepID=A0ABM1DNP2_PRICU|nr:PREDICTED: tetraspanin-33-like [Priapulus caudatus]
MKQPDVEKQEENGARDDGKSSSQRHHRHPSKKKIMDRKETKKKTYVSLIIKYFMFFSNFIFLVFGGFFSGIGLYAFADKGKAIGDALDVLLDPAIPMMIAGAIMFIVSFLGCMGSLRENVCLLKSYAYIMIFIFLSTVMLGALIFILFFSDARSSSLTPDNLLRKAIVKYRDDEDLQDLIDAMQTKFQCCGVGPNGFRDWNINPYFNCSGVNLSVEKCGVPYSCCRHKENEMINVMCGFHTTDRLELEVRDKIYTDGCYPVIMQWMESNALIFGGCAFGIIIPMLLGIFLSLRLVTQIQDQRARWKYR